MDKVTLCYCTTKFAQVSTQERLGLEHGAEKHLHLADDEVSAVA